MGLKTVRLLLAVCAAAFGLAGGSSAVGSPWVFISISSLNNLAEIIIIRTKLTVQRCSAELVGSVRSWPSVVVGGVDSQA